MNNSSTIEVSSNQFSSIDCLGFGGEGEAVALNLYKGHLRTIDGYDDTLPYNVTPEYIRASRGYSDSSKPDIKNWFIPSNDHDIKIYGNWVFKVQEFKAGGYEAVLTKVDLSVLADNMDSERITGKREEGERREVDVISSINRSKTKIRHLIKSMGCDRMVTLTKRELEGSEYWNQEQWAAAWKRFRRLCRDARIDFQYVGVIERHKKGNYHFHVAITGHLNVNTIRRFWFICLGGRGNEKGSATPGNVQISFKPNMTKFERCSRIAKYLSKYLAKQIDYVEFNKKRYWSSAHKLPDVKRYVLKAESFGMAIVELCALRGLDIASLVKTAFQFPNQAGLWFSFDDFLLSPVPF